MQGGAAQRRAPPRSEPVAAAVKPDRHPDCGRHGLSTDDPTLAQIVGDVAPAGQGIPVTIQFDTPGAAVGAQRPKAVLRSIPGVRSATTTSLALGGVSAAARHL